MSKNNSKKELEKKWKKTEQEEMKEESHQVDLKEGYEQDEEYEESEEQYRQKMTQIKCQCLDCECMTEGQADQNEEFICNFCKMGNHYDKY